jgi:thioredoxin reductase
MSSIPAAASTPSSDAAVARHPGLPVVIVGAGPIGLAAAAHAHARGIATLVLEAGVEPAAAIREWGHVRLFSPWSELVDPVAEKLLAEEGWSSPDPAAYPTGDDWVRGYLAPLAQALAARDGVEIRYGSRVVGVARQGRDLVVALGRDAVPFAVHVTTPAGRATLTAAAVIDASGTWGTPNPLGGDGYPAAGEEESADAITYGIPDLRGADTAARFAGRHVVVVGTGASAQNALVGLAELARANPGTRISWLVRRSDVADAFGGGDNDQLVARGELGSRAKQVVAAGPVTTVSGFRTARVDRAESGTLTLTSVDGQQVPDVDQVIVVTGFRPDHTWLSEVHLALDGELGAPVALAPEIHPAFHSCGSVSPHGADLLRQPEGDVYLVGMKSFGRAPSFLTMTGFEQVRSVVAEIAGDHEAAARVELVLPETGVCGGSGLFDAQPAGDGCCSQEAALAL